jgi:hypothetical protein
LLELVKRTTGKNEFVARRLILKKAKLSEQEFQLELVETLQKKQAFVEFPQKTLDRARSALWNTPEAQAYLRGRGFTRQTLEHFDIGYSEKQRMVIVPMHDPKGMPIGLIGRSIEGKRFKNSTNLPKSLTMWNLHRARRASDAVIVCEASFDAMRIHQAGFPNVVALLGGSLSPQQQQLFDKYFNHIIIATDNDAKSFNDNCAKCRKRDLRLCAGHNPGRDLGQAIANKLHRKQISWASHKFGEVFPNGAKDVGDLTDDEIRQCIKNSVSNFEYQSWSL